MHGVRPFLARVLTEGQGTYWVLGILALGSIVVIWPAVRLVMAFGTREELVAVVALGFAWLGFLAWLAMRPSRRARRV